MGLIARGLFWIHPDPSVGQGSETKEQRVSTGDGEDGRRYPSGKRLSVPLTSLREWGVGEQGVGAISTGQLRMLPHFHFPPINLVVFEGPLCPKALEISSWSEFPA